MRSNSTNRSAVLVQAARAGDREAFGQLVGPHLASALGTARLIAGSADAGADAVQEALLSAWLGLDALRDPDAFPAWFRRQVIRAALRWAKRQHRLVELNLEHPAPAGALEQALAVRQLDRAFDRLDPGDRPILALRHAWDLPGTWTASSVPGSYPDTSPVVRFLNPATGYLLAKAAPFSDGTGTILRTSDGGATWHVMSTLTWPGSTFGIAADGTLWIGANAEAMPVAHPLLMASRDGGKTWSKAVLPGLEGRTGDPDLYVPEPPVFWTATTGIVEIADSAGPVRPIHQRRGVLDHRDDNERQPDSHRHPRTGLRLRSPTLAQGSP